MAMVVVMVVMRGGDVVYYSVSAQTGDGVVMADDG